jgi:DNA relaxase NicK
MTPFVDWVSLSIEASDRFKLDKIIEILQFRMLIEFDWFTSQLQDNYSGKWVRYSGTLGTTLALKYASDSDNISVRLTFPGQYIATCQQYEFKRSMEVLLRNGAVCTRIDIAVDDRDKALSHCDIFEHVREFGGVGFESCKFIESIGGANPGKTLYCGARRSAKYARFYQRGDVDRFEIEFKLDLAHSIFVDYCAAHEQNRCAVLAGALKGAISFVYKTDKNLSRCKECSWWIEFLDRIVGEIAIYKRSKPVSSIHRSISWVERSVSKTLLKIKACLGSEGLDRLLGDCMESAKTRITSLDNLHIREYNTFENIVF